MTLMRSLTLVLTAVLLAPIAAAQHHHTTFDFDTPIPNAVTPTGVTRTFTITAQQWSYTISPLPFQANVGDTVTINAKTADVLHGLLMERYVLQALRLDPGVTRTTTFTVDKAGDFLMVCDQSSCGTGHFDMFNTFHVDAAVVVVPTITGFQPTTGVTSGGTAVTITGTNFASGAAVKFGSVSASSVNVQSATSIVATAPAQAAGAASITVTNPDGQSATMNGFTYVIGAPVITNVSPATGPSNGGTQVTITGSNFQTGATVKFGAVAAQSVNVVSPTSIIAVAPPAPATEQQAVGVDITVRNPDAQTVTSAQAFHYTAVALSITGISPNSGSNAGGTLVSISGTGFTSALAGASVTFGGVAGTNLTVTDAATLTVKTPAHANGAVDVAVTLAGHTVTAPAGFSFDSLPPRRRGVKH
jgi:hypothetical protein